MNDENIYGGSAPVLDDIEYTAPAPKKGGPTGVTAPVLDDMDSYVPPTAQKKGAPTGVSAPVLDDDSAPYEARKQEVKIMTDEELIATFTPEQLETYNKFPEENRARVLEQLRKQLGVEAPPVEITAPVLDDDNYTPPVKEESSTPPQPTEEIKAPILDDAPETPVYKPKYVDEDLERAKREAAVKAVSGQLVTDQKDPKESLRKMLALKEEQRRAAAAKGFKLCFVIAAIGVVAGVLFYLLYSGSLGLSYKDGLDGFAAKLKDGSLYIAAAMVVSGLTLATGVGFLKSLTTVIYLISGILQIFPGIIMIPQHNGNLALIIGLYVLSLAATIAVFFMMTGSEAVGAYFSKGSSKSSEYSTTNSSKDFT